MASKAIFNGLVYDENENLVEMTFVGHTAHYVINDQGFKRHVDAETIDRQIVSIFMEQLQANKGLAVEQALNMMGQDDIFAKAALDKQIDDVTIDDIMTQGIPGQARDMLAMLGFKIIVNYRGELVKIDQPAAPDSDDDY